MLSGFKLLFGFDCEEKIKASDIFHSTYFEAKKSYEFIKKQ